MRQYVFFLLVAIFILLLAGFNLSAINLEGEGDLQKAYDPENLIRLHIRAHSNLLEEQELKYMVRDRIIYETRDLFEDVSTKKRAQEVLTTNLHRFRDLVQEVLKEKDKNHEVEVEYKEILFPGQTYGQLHLPLGLYPSLQIVIGEGSGDNWWCVLFPPLCFIDAIEEIDSMEDSREYEAGEMPLEFRFRLTQSYSTVSSYLEQLYTWVMEQELLGHRVRALVEGHEKIP